MKKILSQRKAFHQLIIELAKAIAGEHYLDLMGEDVRSVFEFLLQNI